MICQHDRPTVGLARNDRADGVLAQRDARATARQCGARAAAHRPRHIRVAIIAIFLALHRTDGASTPITPSRLCLCFERRSRPSAHIITRARSFLSSRRRHFSPTSKRLPFRQRGPLPTTLAPANRSKAGMRPLKRLARLLIG